MGSASVVCPPLASEDKLWSRELAPSSQAPQPAQQGHVVLARDGVKGFYSHHKPSGGEGSQAPSLHGGKTGL